MVFAIVNLPAFTSAQYAYTFVSTSTYLYHFAREVKDRDEINEFLRNEIRMTDMKAKIRYGAPYM